MIRRRILLATLMAPALAQAAPFRRHARMALPDAALRNTEGRELRFLRDIAADRLLVIDIISAGCTTICPISSRVMRAVQDLLPAELGARVRLVSLTFDPASDTPERMAAYAAAVEPAAQPDWQWLTGTRREVGRLLRAFRAVAGGDPNNHAPVFYSGDPAAGDFREWFGIPQPQEVVEALAALA